MMAVLLIASMVSVVIMVSGMHELENAENSYPAFFDNSRDRVIDIHVTIPRDDFMDMLVNSHTRRFYGADIHIDGNTYETAGFRIRENLITSNPQSQTRHSFKIKFNRFIKGQKFRGLDELNLINMSGDPSFMREYLALEIMREAGMPAPLAMYVNLYINGHLHGLYLAVESADNSFLTRIFGDHHGDLFRAEKYATLRPDMFTEAFSRKKGTDINHEGIALLIEALDNMNGGEKGWIEEILDVDSALQYIAANVVLGNYGSYLGRSARDFYLYRHNGVFTVIPFRVSSSFGAYRHDNGRSTRVPVNSPVFDTRVADRPLIAKLLEVEEYKERYMAFVDEFIAALQNAEARIAEIDRAIARHVEADPTRFYTFEHYRANVSGTGNLSILTYIRERLDFLT